MRGINKILKFFSVILLVPLYLLNCLYYDIRLIGFKKLYYEKTTILQEKRG